MKTLYIKTFGCQMNEYDSARMADLLAREGISLVEAPEEADILLLNTCSIREKAQEKVFSLLGQWRTLKHERPGRVIGVGSMWSSVPRPCTACRRCSGKRGAAARSWT